MADRPGKADIFYRMVSFRDGFKETREVILALWIDLVRLPVQLLEPLPRPHQDDFCGRSPCPS